MFYTGEESDKELHRRLAAILAHYDLQYSDIVGRFFAHCRPADDPVLGAPDRNGIIQPTPSFLQLQEAVLDIRPKLVCIEAASDVFGGDENKRPQVRGFMGLLRGGLAIKGETAIVLLQHPSQAGLASGTGTSGSTAWNNSVRSRLYLSTVKANGEGEPDRDLRKLEVMKNNYARAGEIIKLRWKDGVFVVESGASSLDRLAHNNKIDDLFLRLLDRFTHSGFSALIRRISARRSAAILGRPPSERDFHRQYRRKPARCQCTRVSGRMIVMALRTDGNHRYSWTKNKRSPFVSWTRPRTIRCSTIS